MFIATIALLLISTCQSPAKINQAFYNDILPAAHRTDMYLPLLKGKKIGLVVNHTSLIGKVHLVDTLKSLNMDVVKIFTPEHGLTGQADAGEKIEDDREKSIPIISLYGDSKKPKDEDLAEIDMLVFDIQDVGVRFFTYIYTLHFVMEAAAENNVPLVLLDRPNPNGFYFDGPVLDEDSRSFVGMHPTPVVYGMTIGEYGQMVNGEGWLANGVECNLTVIENENYNHTMTYDLPVKPSPNLPNLRAVLLYPSLCFFEGTVLSIGRGTRSQFQVIGHPLLNEKFDFSFTPVSRQGASSPKLLGEVCYGMDLTSVSVDEMMNTGKLDIQYLIEMYRIFQEMNQPFFIENAHFDRLAGQELKKQIRNGLTQEDIRASWEDGLEEFKKVREKYLLYPD